MKEIINQGSRKLIKDEGYHGVIVIQNHIWCDSTLLRLISCDTFSYWSVTFNFLRIHNWSKKGFSSSILKIMMLVLFYVLNFTSNRFNNTHIQEQKSNFSLCGLVQIHQIPKTIKSICSTDFDWRRSKINKTFTQVTDCFLTTVTEVQKQRSRCNHPSQKFK